MAVVTLPYMILGSFLAAVSLYTLRSARSFWENRQHAKNMGVPVLYSPVGRFNPFWLLLEPLVKPILRRAPFGLGEWTEYLSHSWAWRDHGKTMQKLGKVFAIVTPAGINVSAARFELATTTTTTNIVLTSHSYGLPTLAFSKKSTTGKRPSNRMKIGECQF